MRPRVPKPGPRQEMSEDDGRDDSEDDFLAGLFHEVGPDQYGRDLTPDDGSSAPQPGIILDDR